MENNLLKSWKTLDQNTYSLTGGLLFFRRENALALSQAISLLEEARVPFSINYCPTDISKLEVDIILSSGEVINSYGKDFSEAPLLLLEAYVSLLAQSRKLTDKSEWQHSKGGNYIVMGCASHIARPSAKLLASEYKEYLLEEDASTLIRFYRAYYCAPIDYGNLVFYESLFSGGCWARRKEEFLGLNDLKQLRFIKK